MNFRKLYYLLKPIIPRNVQIALRRGFVQKKRKLYSKVWPIDKAASKKPEGWSGWRNGKQFAVVLTHDVEHIKGLDNCEQLMHIENQLDFKSSFNFVPERYKVSSKIRTNLMDNGFEVGVHGLLHDGKLYSSKKIFLSRAKKINRYLKEWGAVGFRSPAMHHNLEWIHYLNIEYDASTFDTDPFEPQSDGVGTIFPIKVTKRSPDSSYVELPYTLPQDFTLFVLMKEKNIDIWKKKIDWIAVNGGMALVDTHPDYMNFNSRKLKMGEYPAYYYIDFLKYIKNKYGNEFWQPLPKEIAKFVINRKNKFIKFNN